jgi:hypothetical protein
VAASAIDSAGAEPEVGNRVFYTAVLHERARQQPDVDAFDVEFFEISPMTEIWSKGRVGI